jgi:signal transduction histidine kinase
MAKNFGKAGKPINIHSSLADNLPAVDVDKSQIEQVMEELFLNAVDTMPDGGDLTLRSTVVTHKDIEGQVRDPKPGSYGC